MRVWVSRGGIIQEVSSDATFRGEVVRGRSGVEVVVELSREGGSVTREL